MAADAPTYAELLDAAEAAADHLHASYRDMRETGCDASPVAACPVETRLRSALAAVRAERSTAPTYAELLDALVEMVNQHCSEDGKLLDSWGKATDTATMRLLARAGKLIITGEGGKRVIGRWA